MTGSFVLLLAPGRLDRNRILISPRSENTETSPLQETYLNLFDSIITLVNAQVQISQDEIGQVPSPPVLWALIPNQFMIYNFFLVQISHETHQ